MKTSTETSAEELADLRETRATHLRIMSREQGRRDGWYAALEEIKKKAADAFMRDDERTAGLLKGIVKELGGVSPRHPYLERVDASEMESAARVDAANARLQGSDDA